MSDEHALYERVGDAFVGAPITAGGWSPDAQSGGAVLALLGHVLDDIPTLTPMSVSRVTADLVRPVPVGEPLHIEHDIVREGKKIQVVDLRVVTGGIDHARARVLRIRNTDFAGVAGAPVTTNGFDPSTLIPPPDAVATGHAGMPEFLRIAMDFRRTDPGGDRANGLWCRLRVPVVAGEPIRATSRVTAPMDLVNLIGATFDIAGVTAINPDVTAHVVRPPVGEWVALVGETIFAHEVGHGVSAATMSDERGVFGLTSTSQVLDRLSGHGG